MTLCCNAATASVTAAHFKVQGWVGPTMDAVMPCATMMGKGGRVRGLGSQRISDISHRSYGPSQVSRQLWWTPCTYLG